MKFFFLETTMTAAMLSLFSRRATGPASKLGADASLLLLQGGSLDAGAEERKDRAGAELGESAARKESVD